MSRIHLASALSAMAFLGCQGGPDDHGKPPGTETGDTGGTIDTETTPTWQADGEVGNILAHHTLQTKQSDETYHVAAVFANALQGFTTAAGCLTDDICIQGLPTTPDTFLDTDVEFDTANRDYSWNGYTLGVDTIQAPFFNDILRAVQYYDFTLDGPPLQDHPVVTFNGEWGEYRSETDLVVPEMTVLEPGVTDNIDVTDGVGTIRWTPGGDGEMYLRIQDGDLNRIYWLEDDGEYDLDWTEVGLPGSAHPDMAIGRWSVKQVLFNDNTLNLVGITEQPCGIQVCDNFPRRSISGATGGGNLGSAPKYLGVGYQALIYDGIWQDYTDDGTDVSAAIVFTVFDDNYHPLCEILYDASQNTPTTSWTATNGLPIWQGYDIPTTPGRGNSTCGRVDPAIYGFDDLRSWIEQYQWGIGIGEMSASFEGDLADTFAAQWPVLQPLVHSVYVTQDGTNAEEMSWGRNIDTEGCYTKDPHNTPDESVPDPTNLPDSVYEGQYYYLYDLR